MGRSMSNGFRNCEALDEGDGGEGANRTLLDPVNEPTTVLKTAGATRHPSLSGVRLGVDASPYHAIIATRPVFAGLFS